MSLPEAWIALACRLSSQSGTSVADADDTRCSSQIGGYRITRKLARRALASATSGLATSR